MALASFNLERTPRAAASGWLWAAAVLAGTAAAAWLVQQVFALGALYIFKVLVPIVVIGAVVAGQAQRHLGARPFGVANAVTLTRAAGVALLAGLLGETPTPALAWLGVGVGFAVLALDGVDGRLARAYGTASRFGARFDMETDALLALVLALLALQFGAAGVVVLVAGLMRYAFVAAGAVLPRLRRPLPPSRRRQALCVVQVAALALCLVPWLTGAPSRVFALAAVAAVVVSFAIDLRWLGKVRPATGRGALAS